ncbi:cysteine hydrolase [Mucilaginibacter sp.]|jgi:nicotinamidase-related amidase|uniref:cysteine hydrolase n=1 Tax=Mucilaginibacter sp. TaxID=1882438 RepID=UPI00356706F8
MSQQLNIRVREKYTLTNTALLVVDPYNDFMTEGGKLFESTKVVREQVGTLDNMSKIIAEVRLRGLRVFIVPHRRPTPTDRQFWKFLNTAQSRNLELQAFGKGTWGGEFNPVYGPQDGDIIVQEHFGQSGFANTDLDLQLKQHSITHIILIGMLANTCIESTARFGMELGYHITLVKDATAAASPAGMHAAHEVNGPLFAHAIYTTEDLLVNLPR